MESLLPLRPALQRSLRAAAAWFRSMVDPSTQRMLYSFSVARARQEDRHCPIRDIGTAADLAVLSAATGSHEFDPVTFSSVIPSLDLFALFCGRVDPVFSKFAVLCKHCRCTRALANPCDPCLLVCLAAGHRLHAAPLRVCAGAPAGSAGNVVRRGVALQAAV